MVSRFSVDELFTKRLEVEGQRIRSIELGALVVSDPTYGVGIGTDTPRLRLDISGTNGIRIPVGTSDQRPTTANGIVDLSGVLRYNTTLNQYEGYGSGGWGSLGGVTSINQLNKITADDDYGLRFYTNDSTANVRSMRIFNNGNITIDNDLTVTGSLSGTVVTASQPNITSVGTLTALTVTNTISGSINGNAETATHATTHSQGTNSTLIATTAYVKSQNYITNIANAFAYSYLSGKPSIPTYTSQLTNNSGYITNSQNAFTYSNLLNKPSIPTHTDQLTNNSGYITSSSNITGSSGSSGSCTGNAATATKVYMTNYTQPYEFRLCVSDGVDENRQIWTGGSARYNPNTNTFTAGTFSGSFSGNGASITSLNIPTASSSVKGGIQINPGAWSHPIYKVQMSGNYAYCSVPWTNTHGSGRWISSTGVYRHNDKVGINAYPNYGNLEIGSYVAKTHNTMFHLHHLTYAGSNATYLDNNTGTKYYSLYCSHAIFAGQGYHMPSDERIKENIRDISDSTSLRQLRDISCCYYDYKDKITKGNLTTIGFIAQQVREHLPIAVRLIKNVIPNEMRIIENPQWTPITDVSGTTYKLTIADLEDVSGGTIHRFYYGNDYTVEYNDNVKSMENDPKSFIFEEQWNNVFLYGKEIDDFHALDKAKLFTLNFSATQEIDKIQQAEKTKLEEQTSKLEEHITKLEEQTSKLEEQTSKLEAAEAKIVILETKNQDLETKLEEQTTKLTNLIDQLKANNTIN